jgi:hypothetical protein
MKSRRPTPSARQTRSGEPARLRQPCEGKKVAKSGFAAVHDVGSIARNVVHLSADPTTCAHCCTSAWKVAFRRSSNRHQFNHPSSDGSAARSRGGGARRMLKRRDPRVAPDRERRPVKESSGRSPFCRKPRRHPEPPLASLDGALTRLAVQRKAPTLLWDTPPGGREDPERHGRLRPAATPSRPDDCPRATMPRFGAVGTRQCALKPERKPRANPRQTPWSDWLLKTRERKERSRDVAVWRAGRAVH